MSLVLDDPSLLNRRPQSRSVHRARSIADGNNIDFEYWFEQLIDHNNPSAGTFKQRYFFSDQYWKGDGSPIILHTPGETPADGYFSVMEKGFLQNKMMIELGAAGVILEHRYWGKSSPVPDLTTANLQWLTVEQGVEDLKHFAENVQLPFNATSTSPDRAPWILLGCGYSGLLTAYTQKEHSDVFAAAYASSAPVQADGNFWEYWKPIEAGMPWNCSSDLSAAVEYMDNVMLNGTAGAVLVLKTKFGLESLMDDDFARALTYPLITWQDLQPPDFGNEGQALFFNFCDAVETNADGTINQLGGGVGLPQALENWAAYFKAIGPDVACPGTGGACYSTYNYSSDSYKNTSIANTIRGWEWLLCTQLGAFLTGSSGSIVSQMLDAASQDRRCAHLFLSPTGDPQLDPYNTSQSASAFNLQYGGWNLVANNLFVVNGEFDPWRSASLSSQVAPASVNAPTQEVVVIPNGHYCWDWSTENAAVNPDVEQIQDLGISKILSWLGQWYEAHPDAKNSNSFSPVTLGTENGSTVSSLNDTANSMQAEINRLMQGKRAAIASYVFNAVLILALLAVLALIIKERTLKKGRAKASFMPETESRAHRIRLLPQSPRSSSGFSNPRDRSISDPIPKSKRVPAVRSRTTEASA